MPALINNYSVFTPLQINRSNAAIERYKSDIFYSYPSSTTIVFWSAPALNNRIFELINEYEQLEANWDNEDALPISNYVITSARNLAKILQNIDQPIYHVAPGPNGEIMLDLRNDSKTKSIEIILYSTKAVAVKFPETGSPEQIGFENSKLPELLVWLNEK